MGAHRLLFAKCGPSKTWFILLLIVVPGGLGEQVEFLLSGENIYILSLKKLGALWQEEISNSLFHVQKSEFSREYFKGNISRLIEII